MMEALRIVTWVLLIIHGVAHLPGFLAAWELRRFPEVPRPGSILGGRVNLRPFATRVLGTGWLLVGAFCLGAGVAGLLQLFWAPGAAWAAVVFSTALCLTALPVTRLGLATNVVLGLLLAATTLPRG